MIQQTSSQSPPQPCEGIKTLCNKARHRDTILARHNLTQLIKSII